MTSDNANEKYEQALSKLAPSERRAIEVYNDRKSPGPRLTAEKSDGKVKISNDHPDEAIGLVMLAQELGTADLDFAGGVIGEIADLSWVRTPNEHKRAQLSAVNDRRSAPAKPRADTAGY